MTETGSHEFGNEPHSQSRSEPDSIMELREARNQLNWAGKKARMHLVRLGKWKRERGEPKSTDLSGAATLVKIGDKKGILTAAHNIRCKFPGGKDSHKGETMDVIFGKFGGPTVVWTEVDLTYATITGGSSFSEGNPEDMGPDIAWIPLWPEEASFFERYGRVFFDWRDNRFPNTSSAGESQTDQSRQIAVGHLVTGFSDERERAALHLSGPYLLEIVQDAFPADKEWTLDGWDYQERVLDSGDEYDEGEAVFDTNIPVATRAAIPLRVEHVGGLSGGGLWRFGGDENDRHFDLAGVVWYRRWRDQDGELRIVNHGRESIRRIIAPEIGTD